MEQPSAPDVERGRLHRGKSRNQRRAQRLDDAVVDAAAEQRKIAAVERCDERRDAADVRDDDVEAVRAFLDEAARFGGRHLAMRMHDRDAQAVGHRQRHHLERIVARTSTNPPITLGATLSAWGVPDAAHSPSIALKTTSRSDNGRPSISLAATAPAALLAPELPSPLASGICLCSHKRSPCSLPARRSTSAAARPATFLVGSRLSVPPSPVTSTISTPGVSESSASSTSPGLLSARPNTSKPGPILATVAGANTRIRRFSMNWQIIALRFRNCVARNGTGGT